MKPLSDSQKIENVDDTASEVRPAVRVGLLQIAATFLRLGATTFGGMWASINKLEDELVRRRGWVSAADIQFSALAATILPSPKFLSLGGLVGFRLRGWLGALVATLCLIIPSASIVLLGVILLNPTLLEGPLAPMRRTVGIAVVGLLFGNSYQQLVKGKVHGARRGIGMSLGFGVAFATIAGVPLLVSALVGFSAGLLLIPGGTEGRSARR